MIDFHSISVQQFVYFFADSSSKINNVNSVGYKSLYFKILDHYRTIFDSFICIKKGNCKNV